ncbi:uncharacterized protein LOC103026331 [Astyanax mexicanus]|uniref:uncharacterized protein LOC103026331 n=1 Tax=Astyanax mexicanus TaxID=7994 RepID=UPI0020CAB701|nr:uncharacterized protein LOC103026331 [Astyanax mexicanus]
MKKLLIIVALTGLLSSGAESFKVSQKDYENIDQMLEFGVQVFLNCLDKVKEATEKMIKHDMIRTNRIAIQNNWNSFKETANKISVEERGKDVQDDLVVAARTVRRLVLFYKDDVKNMIHSFATERNVPIYQPVLILFKGTIEKAKVNEAWGILATNYFPDAPPIQSEPLEFLCYLLSTNVMETVIVNVLKYGVDLMTEMKKIDLDQLSERVFTAMENFSEKYEEIKRLEREKENDTLVVLVSSLTRTVVFYWDRFLNSTDTPLLETQYEDIKRKLSEQNLGETIEELLKPITESDTIKDVVRLHVEFYDEFYQAFAWSTIYFAYGESDRITRTLWTGFMSAVVNSYPIYEKLSEMGVFSTMKKQYLRAVDVAVALAGTEEFQAFREEYFEKWKSFREELNRLASEERRKPSYVFPQIRASIRMFLNKSEEMVNKINAEIDDNTLTSLTINWAYTKTNCIDKLLNKGAITKDQMDEADRIFMDGIRGFCGKYEELTEGMDKEKVEDTFKALLKVVMVGLNFIYSSLTQTWDFVAI